MLFHVRTRFIPPSIDERQLASLIESEQIMAGRLQERGVIVQLWRVPESTSTVGIWSASDEEELLHLISELPCSAYMEKEWMQVVAHPNSIRGIRIDDRFEEKT